MPRSPGGQCFVYTQGTQGVKGDSCLWRGTWVSPSHGARVCVAVTPSVLESPGQSLQRVFGLLQGIHSVDKCGLGCLIWVVWPAWGTTGCPEPCSLSGECR